MKRRGPIGLFLKYPADVLAAAGGIIGALAAVALIFFPQDTAESIFALLLAAGAGWTLLFASSCLDTINGRRNKTPPNPPPKVH